MNRGAKAKEHVARKQATQVGHQIQVTAASDRKTRFPAHRSADPRPGRVARGDPGPHAGADPGSRL
jgi:hypothetical protein